MVTDSLTVLLEVKDPSRWSRMSAGFLRVEVVKMIEPESSLLMSVRREQFNAGCVVALVCCLLFLRGDLTRANSRVRFQAIDKSASRAQQEGVDVRLLELGKPIEREVAGGQSHFYQIALTADQYLRVEVAQRGVNVILELFDPAGMKLTEVDNARGKQGSELLTFIAEVSGNYRIQISVAEKNAPAGRYEVKVIALKVPTADERSLEEARGRSGADRSHRDSLAQRGARSAAYRC